MARKLGGSPRSSPRNVSLLRDRRFLSRSVPKPLIQMIGARGQLLPNRILKEKISFVVIYARFSRTARVIWEPTGHLEGRKLAFGAISPRAAPQEGTHARHSSSPGSTLRRSSTLASGSPARAQCCYVQRLDCLGRPHFLPTCAPPSQAVQRRRVQAHRPNRRYARVSCRPFPGAASVARPEAPSTLRRAERSRSQNINRSRV